MKMDYDIIVIGSGPGGSRCATKLSKEGKKVAVIDSLFGGTCALQGCTPKKAMETVSSTFWSTKNLEGKGFSVQEDFLNWNELLAHQKHFTELIPKGTIEKFEKAGITCLEGKATFLSENTIEVNEKSYTAKRFIIATGATEVPLKFKGADLLKTSFDFFRITNFPEHITFIGGGYIAFELSHIAAACGCKVTIINDEEEFLTQFSSEFAQKIMHATLDKGVDIKLNCTVKKVSHSDRYSVLFTKKGENTEKQFKTDLVIHSAGRVPAVAGLNVERANLKLNKNGGLDTNKHLQTNNNKKIFAVGDVTGKLPFTEVAGYEADLVVHNILHPKKLKSAKYKGVPAVLFTYPKLATVGKSKNDLKSNKKKFTIYEGKMDHFLLQRTANNSYAAFKIFVSKKNKILGAEILGLRADDMINIIAMAMQTNMTFKKLNKLLLAYPTATHDVKGFD